VAGEAARLAPTDFDVRLRLGRLLFGAGRWEEAQVELEWCERRQPNRKDVRELLTKANRESLLRQADVSQTPLSTGRVRRQ
jgi:protein involved in temperature-dependent protein secretion